MLPIAEWDFSSLVIKVISEHSGDNHSTKTMSNIKNRDLGGRTDGLRNQEQSRESFTSAMPQNNTQLIVIFPLRTERKIREEPPVWQ